MSQKGSKKVAHSKYQINERKITKGLEPENPIPKAQTLHKFNRNLRPAVVFC